MIYGLLLGVWVLVVAWQVEEHVRVREAAKNDLRKRSEAIANTLGAVVRGLQFHGAVFRDRLEPVLGELTNGPASGEVVSIEMLNATNGVMASAGRSIDYLQQPDILQAGEHWGLRTMTRVYPVEGAFLTNMLIVEVPTNFMRGGPRGFPRREPRPGEMGTSNTNGSDTNAVAAGHFEPPPPPDDRSGPPREGEPRPPRLPFWARGLDEKQYEDMKATHELHGLLLTLSTQSLQAVVNDDLWLRCIIVFFAGISALGAGLAWRNTGHTADLQIRLVRASELNSHLREMNLAAAGLAHETRNPLNIIRGHRITGNLPNPDGGYLMRITVVGCGHLGAVHAACMAEIGHEVLGVDIDQDKVSLLNSGRVWFHEPGLDEMLSRNVAAGRVRFTTSFAEAAGFGRVHFLGVATPGRADGNYDLTQVTTAVQSLASYASGPCLIVGKSTVAAGHRRVPACGRPGSVARW